MLVLAGAGTGKTRVVTFRIARLISKGIAPDRILAVTFTKKAANEMKERVGQLLPQKKDQQLPEISTFHSLCVRILRRHSQRLGYPARFAIYATGQQESVARQALREINVPGATLKPSDLLFLISGWKSRSILPPAAAAQAYDDRQHLAAIAYRRYQQKLKAAGAFDFDDLLLGTEQLFREFADVHHDEARRFDHILVDEYQDTNDSQYRIIKALAAGHRNLCVVGDDDQSIYGWRGAEVEHILGFKRDWPEARVVRLENNYRSTPEIIEWANRLISYNTKRHKKTLLAHTASGIPPGIRQFENEVVEAERVVADIQRRIDKGQGRPGDFAILFRTNEQPRTFEAELRKRKIPYVLIGGMSFFDRKEVRDVMAFAQVLEEPRDEVSLRRIINVPPRGIGDKTVASLTEAAVKKGCPLWDVLNDPLAVREATGAGSDSVAKFVDTVKRFRSQLCHRGPHRTLLQLIGQVGYQDDLTRQYPDAQEQESRWAAVGEVINSVADYEATAKKPSLGQFLEKMLLDGPESTSEKEKQLRRDAVVLMTLHAAKGLEFPQVYMVGMEEGLLPHHRSIKEEGSAVDEERRLCYVGITRARERLVLTLANTRRKWGKPRPTHPSRFLMEMTGLADKATA